MLVLCAHSMALRRPLLFSLVLTQCARLAFALSTGSIRSDVPVALRPLQRQEIVDKLDAVPVFSVVNRQTQQVVPAAAENGVLCCYFHLDVDEASASLAALQSRNPTLPLALSATPLGTAFALCEWERQASQEEEDPEEEGIDFSHGDDYDEEPDAPKIELRLQAALRPAHLCNPRLCASAPTSSHRCTSMPLQAARAEVKVATPLLAEAPVPPLLRRRNQASGG